MFPRSRIENRGPRETETTDGARVMEEVADVLINVRQFLDDPIALLERAAALLRKGSGSTFRPSPT